MKILVYDTETNDIDTENGFIQELAWAIYDSETWRCLKAQSFLISWPTAYEVSPEAFAVTGLSREYCHANGAQPHAVFTQFLWDANSADALCGHNAIAFDLPMLKTNVKRGMLFGLDDSQPYKNLPHIDTLLDVEYPKTQKIHALKYLALDHGYVMSNAHEALADVFACAHILSKYDINRVLEIAKTPIVKMTSKIDWNNQDARDRIKQQRFYWNPTLKLWEKSIREFFVPGIQLQLGSDVELLITR